MLFYQTCFLYSILILTRKKNINKQSCNLFIFSHGIFASSKLMTMLFIPIVISLSFFLKKIFHNSFVSSSRTRHEKNIVFIRSRARYRYRVVLRQQFEPFRIYLLSNQCVTRVLNWSPLTDSSFSWFERTRFEWNMVSKRFFKLSLTFDNTTLFFNDSNTVKYPTFFCRPFMLNLYSYRKIINHPNN